MRQAFITTEIREDAFFRPDFLLDMKEYLWEKSYKVMRSRIPPGPWRFHESERRVPDAPTLELRLEVRLP